MNSILRQSHIKLTDLQQFLRNYDSSNTIAVSNWAKAACAELEPGSLLFIVEPVTLPFGLITFSHKEEENFRVSDFAMVVRIVDSKAVAVNLTNSTYELRFLESLLEERARKSIIERKRFSFVAAKPVMPLSLTKFQELERLSNLYAKGGSRRSFVNNNSQEEPALSLLNACGVHMVNANKQSLDIGSVCYSLFNTDTKIPDKNRAQLKEAFIPLSSDFSAPKPIPITSEDFDAEGKRIDSLSEKMGTFRSENQEITGFNLLQSWGGNPHSAQNNAAPLEAISAEIAEQKNKLKETENMPLGFASRDLDDVQKGMNVESKDINKLEDALTVTAKPAENLKVTQADDVYKHLSEAITGLLGVQQQEFVVANESMSQSSLTDVPNTAISNIDVSNTAAPNIATPNIDVSNIDAQEEKIAKWPSARSFEDLPVFKNPIVPLPEAVDSEPGIAAEEHFTEQVSSEVSDEQNIFVDFFPGAGGFVSEAKSTSIETGGATDETPKESFLSEESTVSQSVELADLGIDSENSVSIFSVADAIPSKLDDFQEPKAVMNEMASLTNKLESQVARAAKKLAAKTSEVEKSLSANVDALLILIKQEDTDSYAELVVRIDVLSKQFESLFDTLKAELAEKAASSREQIKTKRTTYEEKIEKSEKEHRENFAEEFKQKKIQFDRLVEEQESELNKLINVQTEILKERMQSADQTLEESSVSFGVQLEDHFSNFKERVEEKVQILLKAFDSQMDTTYRDIERLHLVGSEDLVATQNEFFSKLERLMRITEIDLSRQVRNAQIESFLPRLKERKQIIEAMMHEMTQTFAEHSFSQAKAQSEGAEHSLVLARQQLKELVEERLSKLDMVGRNQQAGLEEIFKSAAAPLEQHTASVVQLIKQTEHEINECEVVCTKLAQSYNLDSDPKLTALCQEVYNKVDLLKVQLRKDLDILLDENCLKLENVTKNYQNRLNNRRAELVQQVRADSDKGLLSIRQAIHDAFHTIQSQREKYME